MTTETKGWESCGSFDAPRAGHQSLVLGERLYVLGGYFFNFQRNDLVLFDDVQYAPLDSGGTLGEWQRTTPFRGARSGHGCVVHNGRIYVIGGGDGNRFFSDVQHAEIEEDGRIGPSGWQADQHPLVVARSAHGCGVLVREDGAFLYVAGGAGAGEGRIAHFDSVEYAPIHDDGSVGAWTLCPNRFTEGRAHCGVAIIDQHIHVVGGWGDYDLFADTQEAPILPDGSTGAWKTRRSTLNFSRFGHATTCYRDARLPVLLVLGGVRAGEMSTRSPGSRGQRDDEVPPDLLSRSGPTSRGRFYQGPGRYLGDVQYSVIRPDTPSPWIPSPEELDFAPPRSCHASAIHGDSLFIMGGYTATGEFLSDVLRLDLAAVLGPDGSAAVR